MSPCNALTLSLATLMLGLVLQTQTVDAIKCYVCQSNIDPKCADPFDNLTLPITDCDAYPRGDLAPKTEFDVIEEKGFLASFGLPAPATPLQATMCRKIRQKVNGEWRTIRGCGYLGPPGDSPEKDGDFCELRRGTYDISVEVCTCNSKDGCNAADSLISSKWPASAYVLASCLALLYLLSF